MPPFRITPESGIPLIGSLYFGIIDRGTSLLQVRPNCSCNISCPFCSVDAGPTSRTRVTAYEVERDYLVQWVTQVAGFKGDGVECHIDSPGEPLLYPEIIPLVRDLKQIPEVKVVSMQTNGTLLSGEKIAGLESAGLDRLNLSLHALDPELARTLAGVSWYDVGKVKEAARRVAGGSIDLLVAPVYLPGSNDAEIPRIIAFAKEIGAGKRWPALGIQKCEHYRYGRNIGGMKFQTWWQFYNRSIRGWEKESGMKLLITPRDFGIGKREMLPPVFRKGEKVRVDIRAPGWIRGEMLGVGENRVVSVMDCPRDEGAIRVQIVSAKHGIYVARPA
ncbi:MAG TPA: radical SAM protein [Methanomicrobiales archaeon]|nr:radical SAM protein [Methanomicrobiales archaeon]